MTNPAQETTAGNFIGLPPQITTTNEIDQLAGTISEIQVKLEAIRGLLKASENTGGFVEIIASHGFMPIVRGNDNRVVPVFRIVEVIDEVLDYDRVKAELPNLSFTQVSAVVSFLHRVAQFNVRGVDIDALEDELEVEDSQLLTALRQAVADRETARVLFYDQSDGG